MGHTYRTRWTDQLVEDKIKECMSILGILRMPTRQEIIDTVGNPVACKITKTLGYYGWAEKLGLPVKDSDSTTGRVGELLAKKKLEETGFIVDKMTTKFPYDLLVGGIAKINVKYSRLYLGKSGNFYSFNLENKTPVCDFYILITEAPDGRTRFLVVPAINAQIKQISVGEFSSKWYKYENRFDMIEQYIKAISKIE